MSIVINPGTGPVPDATEEAARENARIFADDVRRHFDCGVSIEPEFEDLGDGRWAFEMVVDGRRTYVIDMPGIAIDDVRFMDDPDQNIWDFPRLYVDGSSWIWLFAIGCCGPEDDQ